MAAGAGAEGTLIDRPRLQARALDGLGPTLISGDPEAAVEALSPGAPTLGLHALAPDGPMRCASAARARSW